MLTACDRSSLSPENSRLPLQLELDITSQNIKTVQEIEATFTVTNISFEKVSVGFPSSCQHGFTIERAKLTVLDSQTVIGCLAVTTKLDLESLESKNYQISLQGMADSDSLESGVYQIKAFLLNEKSPQAETSFYIH